jgi:hypothetical protein
MEAAIPAGLLLRVATPSKAVTIANTGEPDWFLRFHEHANRWAVFSAPIKGTLESFTLFFERYRRFPDWKRGLE